MRVPFLESYNFFHSQRVQRQQHTPVTQSNNTTDFSVFLPLTGTPPALVLPAAGLAAVRVAGVGRGLFITSLRPCVAVVTPPLELLAVAVDGLESVFPIALQLACALAPPPMFSALCSLPNLASCYCCYFRSDEERER